MTQISKELPQETPLEVGNSRGFLCLFWRNIDQIAFRI